MNTATTFHYILDIDLLQYQIQEARLNYSCSIWLVEKRLSNLSQTCILSYYWRFI